MPVTAGLLAGLSEVSLAGTPGIAIFGKVAFGAVSMNESKGFVAVWDDCRTYGPVTDKLQL
jgi:hypothetical protein